MAELTSLTMSPPRERNFTYYRRFFFSPDSYGRVLVHNPFGSARNKAKDIYINGLTLKRLLHHKDQEVRRLAEQNAWDRKETWGRRSQTIWRTLRLRPNFDRLLVLRSWNVPQADGRGLLIDSAPFVARIEKNILSRYTKAEDVRLIVGASTMAWEGHKGVMREDGVTPYFEHVLWAAERAARDGLDAETVAAILCHDTEEDASIGERRVSHEFIVRNLNQTVANLIEGVTKLGKEEQYHGPRPSYIDRQKKELQYIYRDIRTFLVRLYERRHNMLTIESLQDKVDERGNLIETRAERQRRVAEETLNVHARLARAFGIWKISRELEASAFAYLDTEQYNAIEKKVSSEAFGEQMDPDAIAKKIKDRLGSQWGNAVVEVKRRTAYELKELMERERIGIEELQPSHVWRINIVVEKKSQCYGILEHLSHCYPVKEIYDHIAEPYPDEHQLMLVVLKGVPPAGMLEVEIRDKKMLERYQYGVIEDVKAGKYGRTKFAGFIDRLANQVQEEGGWVDSREAYYNAIREISNPITVFTMSGEQKQVPFGSTPVDFAALLHRDLLRRMSQVFIDNRLADFGQKLYGGESIRIEKHSQARPKLIWLEYATTEEARKKLRNLLRSQDEITILNSAMERLEVFCDEILIDGQNLIQTALFKEVFDARASFVIKPEEWYFASGECPDKFIAQLKRDFFGALRGLEGLDSAMPLENMVLSIPYLYELLQSRGEITEKHPIIEMLTRRTKDYRDKQFSELYPIQQARIVRLNRLLIEMVYSGAVPKVRRMGAEKILYDIGTGQLAAKKAIAQLEDRYAALVRSHREAENWIPYYIAVTTADRPGVIAQLSGNLSKIGLSIVDIELHRVAREEGALAHLILGVGVLGTQKEGKVEGGGILGEIQRLQVNKIAKKVGNVQALGTGQYVEMLIRKLRTVTIESGGNVKIVPTDKGVGIGLEFDRKIRIFI